MFLVILFFLTNIATSHIWFVTHIFQKLMKQQRAIISSFIEATVKTFIFSCEQKREKWTFNGGKNKNKLQAGSLLIHFLTYACVSSKLGHPSGLSAARVHITQLWAGRSQRATRMVLGAVEIDKRDHVLDNLNPKKEINLILWGLKSDLFFYG